MQLHVKLCNFYVALGLFIFFGSYILQLIGKISFTNPSSVQYLEFTLWYSKRYTKKHHCRWRRAGSGVSGWTKKPWVHLTQALRKSVVILLKTIRICLCCMEPHSHVSI